MELLKSNIRFFQLLTSLAVLISTLLIPTSLPAAEPLFSFRSAPLYAQTKIFLVAGSGQAANFAQEILEQKSIWQRAGFSSEEIACYYVSPTERDFRQDLVQFLEVAPQLSDCYPASVSLIRKHLKLIGKGKEKPPFLYLYFTSHGERPLAYQAAKTRSKKMERKILEEKSRYPVLNQYLLRIDGLPDGAASFNDLLASYREGMDPEELFLTPSYLRNLLEASYKDVPKFLVLQGCYTGGFLEDPNQGSEGGLKSLFPLTLITAARFDRASFGCEPGVESTDFGGIYNEVLSSRADDPRRINWKALYEKVRAKVREREYKEDRSPPSEPAFFSNFGAEGEEPQPNL